MIRHTNSITNSRAGTGSSLEPTPATLPDVVGVDVVSTVAQIFSDKPGHSVLAALI